MHHRPVYYWKTEDTTHTELYLNQLTNLIYQFITALYFGFHIFYTMERNLLRSIPLYTWKGEKSHTLQQKCKYVLVYIERVIHVITFRWPCWRFGFHFLEIVFSFLETVRRQVWHIISKFSSVRLKMKLKRNTWTKLQLISFQSILLLLKKPEFKKNIYTDTYDSFQAPLYLSLCLKQNISIYIQIIIWLWCRSFTVSDY